MNLFKKTVLICLSIYAIIGIGIFLFGDTDKISFTGLAGFLISIAYLIIGLLLCIPKQTRYVGLGMLLSSGIVFTIGISMCTMQPIRI
jgi:hypothetical protein